MQFNSLGYLHTLALGRSRGDKDKLQGCHGVGGIVDNHVNLLTVILEAYNICELEHISFSVSIKDLLFTLSSIRLNALTLSNNVNNLFGNDRRADIPRWAIRFEILLEHQTNQLLL
jgi:hypothetical protein